MSYETLKMFIKNERLRDKKSLSQKLINTNSRFPEFWYCEIVCRSAR